MRSKVSLTVVVPAPDEPVTAMMGCLADRGGSVEVGAAAFRARLGRSCVDPRAPFVEQAVVGRGDDRALAARTLHQRAAVERRADTARLVQDELPGGMVPQHLTAVQVDVEPAGGNETPFERAGAEVALRIVRRAVRQLVAQGRGD